MNAAIAEIDTIHMNPVFAAIVKAVTKSSSTIAEPSRRVGRKEAGVKLVPGHKIVIGDPRKDQSITTLGQYRKPPTMNALRRARTLPPFLIRSF